MKLQDTIGTIGVMLYTPEGIPIKTTVDNTTAAQVVVNNDDDDGHNILQYQNLVSTLTATAKSIVRELDPTNELTFFRMKSTSHEVLVAPSPHFLMIVLQKSDLSQE